VDPLPVRKVSDAIDGDEVWVVNFRNERWALPLQHVPILGVIPRVEPHDVVLHHAGVRCHARPAARVHWRAERRCLGDELAGAGTVETPVVVYALEAPLSSIRTSKSDARRCGQASSKTRHSPAPRSYQSTMMSPSTILPCGTCRSRSHTGASGYHRSSQSNRSSPDGDGCCSSVCGVSVATEDTDSRAARPAAYA
jgi:hypothetical protein